MDDSNLDYEESINKLESKINMISNGKDIKKQRIKKIKRCFDSFIIEIEFKDVTKEYQLRLMNIILNNNFLINSGTINCYLNKFFKYIEYHNCIYLLELLNQFGSFKIKIINTIIDNIIKIIVLNSNNFYISHYFLNYLLVLIKKNNLFISYDYGYKLVSLIINFQNYTCNNLSINEKNLLLKSLCYIHWYPFYICEHNTNSLEVMNIEFTNFVKNYKLNTKDHQFNKFPKYIRNGIKQFLFSKESANTYKVFKEIKSQIKYYQSINGKKPIIILDGGNIGYHYNNSNFEYLPKKTIFIKYIINFIKLPIMNHFNYIIILNEKHKNDFHQYPNSDQLRVFFTPKNVDDDKFILNLALSFNHTFILSNDRYNNYFHKIKNNILLQESWKLIFTSIIINFDIFKEQFYVLKYPELILCQDYENDNLSFVYYDNKKNKKQYKFLYTPIKE